MGGCCAQHGMAILWNYTGLTLGTTAQVSGSVVRSRMHTISSSPELRGPKFPFQAAAWHGSV
jgi:hypothetical protein